MRCETRKRGKSNAIVLLRSKTSHSLIPLGTFVGAARQHRSRLRLFSFTLFVFFNGIHSFIADLSMPLSHFLFFLLSLFALLCAFGLLVRLIALTHTHICVSCIFIQYFSSRVEFSVVVPNMLSLHFSMGLLRTRVFSTAGFSCCCRSRCCSLLLD